MFIQAAHDFGPPRWLLWLCVPVSAAAGPQAAGAQPLQNGGNFSPTCGKCAAVPLPSAVVCVAPVPAEPWTRELGVLGVFYFLGKMTFFSELCQV